MVTKRKRGKPPFQVTPTLQRRVEEYLACGMSEDAAAIAIGCSTPTLRKYFAEQITFGRSKKQAEVIQMLWKAGRKGNMTAITKLIGMTGATVAQEAFEKPTVPKSQRLGKKEEAANAAVTAGEGTDWGDDLRAPAVGPN